MKAVNIIFIARELTLGVVGKTSTSEVEGVDNGQGEGASETTGGDVGGHLSGV